jgi:hypothetical protein
MAAAAYSEHWIHRCELAVDASRQQIKTLQRISLWTIV